MSSGSSELSVIAGLVSAPEASDIKLSSNGLRGVVKAGFRNADAVLLLCMLGEKREICGGGGGRFEGVPANRVGLEGLEKGFGLELANLLGELKPTGKSKGLGKSHPKILSGRCGQGGRRNRTANSLF